MPQLVPGLESYTPVPPSTNDTVDSPADSPQEAWSYFDPSPEESTIVPPPEEPSVTPHKFSEYLPLLEGSNTVPPAHYGRTLVLCFDGIENEFDQENSSIVELFTLLKKDDRKKQMVYYQAGTGARSRKVVTPFMAGVSKTLDKAVAWNLDAHVMDGYEFLMQNYCEGDRICIFGFSRGALTARCLIGMIHRVGLLPAWNRQQVPFAYKMYADPKYSQKEAKRFKRVFSTDVDIEFVGVWDAIDSVGLIPRTLPLTRSNRVVRTFRHAMSLDERRAKFKARMSHRDEEDSDDEGTHASDYTEDQISKEQGLKKLLEHQHQFGSEKLMFEALKEKYSKDRTKKTDVWFAGCHRDLGGESVDSATEYSLSRIPLRWMIRECFRTNSGIIFDAELLRDMLGMEPDHLYPEVLERPKSLDIDPDVDVIKSRKDIKSGHFSKPVVPGSRQHTSHSHQHLLSSSETTVGDNSSRFYDQEQERELADLLSPIHDPLSMKPLWWILEIVPLFQRTGGSLGINWGRGRVIPEPRPDERVLVHRSVQFRMEAADRRGTRYEPKAENWKQLAENIEWVD
uniref:T6SS Phospholipase effector Tle1-like catalytic domain-containing protein n=1 Tax=Moniliophthora roreri TaxID=221103 RepID=A0A0W0G4G1_MONRR